MREYRILEYYFTFFGHNAYRLQKRVKFLRWEWWHTVAKDKLGATYHKWQKEFDCPIVNLKEIE
jgi:hypothetical protein